MAWDHALKAKWLGANQRALRRHEAQGLEVPSSPIASSLDLDVHSTLTVDELKAKIRKKEEERPGFIRASYKGCCLTKLRAGFPQFYKKVLETMLHEAEKKSLKRQAKQKTLTQEALSDPIIKKAISIFKPVSVEVRALRVRSKSRRRHGGFRGSVDSVQGS